MQTTSKRHLEQLWEELSNNLTLDLFDEEKVDEILGDIKSFDPRFRQKALALCSSLSHSGSGLVPSVLRRIKTAAKSLSPKETEQWITQAFDFLESKGMDSFFQFLSKTDKEDLETFKNLEGLHLHSVISLLETYICGISGISMKIAAGNETYTDTETLYLPRVISFYQEAEKNFLIYKLLVVYQWAQISQGSLTLEPRILRRFLKDDFSSCPDINSLFNSFHDRELAVDLYAVLDACRIEKFLAKELPGLMKLASQIKEDLFCQRPEVDTLPDKTALVEGLYQYHLSGHVRGPLSSELSEALTIAEQLKTKDTCSDTLDSLCAIWGSVSHLQGEYRRPVFLYPGVIDPQKISLCQQARRKSLQEKIQSVITKLINLPEIEIESFLREKRKTHMPLKNQPKKDVEYLVLKGKLFELDHESKEIIHEAGIFTDGILLDASSVGQNCATISVRDFIEDESPGEVQGGIKYDEWDFRRGDYKKAWCSLFERDIPPGEEPFVELTLKRYAGYTKVLRRKFELLKKEMKLLRRQKEGDDIDIDATIEAYADMKAGLAPSHNLFVKLDRQARSIAALFLLDMSGSTKGWVNQSEKEALVLMCEALESLGDRYAIYGFSGETRNRTEYFKIKSFCEEYSEAVKKRIAGIVPKEYTRMGPPIRHSARILSEIDAKTKLLITLSDGHPEDRDGYRGDYGIEDTRKALIEAKDQDIKPFCITIDKEASSYLPHMFGEVNYILLDEVRKLPSRITEIYRKLTT